MYSAVADGEFLALVAGEPDVSCAPPRWSFPCSRPYAAASAIVCILPPAEQNSVHMFVHLADVLSHQ